MSFNHPNRDLIALGIRQPWAELILRGIKSIEIRSLPTNVRGTIYLYTGTKFADTSDVDVLIEQHRLNVNDLIQGRLVGTVDIVDSRSCTTRDAGAACVSPSLLRGKHAWCLANPVRLDEPLKARFRPYGVWFYPFKRRRPG